ncbi:kinase-like domain-containing protein [Nemania sp. FL0916]|nr:kinase-like domain-containing protein [Nemania sp. FL0916]
MRHRIRGATQLYGLRTQVIYGRPQRAGALTATNANHNDLWQQDRKDMLFLECCQNGDLQTLLYRLHEDDENKNIPMRVLYAFWLCLIRACVALQYPPRKFHPKRTHAAPPVVNGQPGFDDSVGTKVVGTDLFEDIPPPRRRWDKKRNVHFDIDPKNIFIADLDANTKDEEHRLIPRIKLADFGLHEQIKPDKTNLYYLRRRFTGKPLYWAPEQFGADWDSIRSPFRDAPRGNGREVSTQRIAGNYNAPMNVWGVALVMWQLITKADPPFPPRSQAQNGQHANLPRNYCELLLEPKRYDHIDLEFRRTIARCMAHNPRERPLLQDLLKQAKRWIKVRAGERDRVVDQWVQDNIFNA